MTSQVVVHVRCAEPRDAAALLRLKSELQVEDGGVEAFVADLNVWSQRMFGDEPYFQAMIAESGAQAVGMLTYSAKYYTGWPAAALFVQDLFVDPSFRREGIAALLLQSLAQHAIGNNIEHIELVVRADNPARGFYERIGFCAVEQAMIYIAGRAAMGKIANRTVSDKS